MTRINAGISPSDLCDQHLVAEYRELGRIRKAAIDNIDSTHKIPRSFRFGTGHVLFFIDKGEYLKKRFLEIKDEMGHRGFVSNLAWRSWPSELRGNWEPTEVDIHKVKNRIASRIRTMKKTAKWTKRSRPKWVDDTLRNLPAPGASRLTCDCTRPIRLAPLS